MHDPALATAGRRRNDYDAKMQGMEAGSTNARLDALDAKVDGFGEQQRQLRQEMKVGFDRVDKRFEKLEGRFGGLEGRFEKLENRFEGLEDRFGRLEGRFDRLQMTILAGTLGILAAVIVGVLGIFAALIGFS